MISSLSLLLDQKIDQKLEAGLYDENELLEIRVPISLPYQSNWSDFESYSGELEWRGAYYKFVKRKITNDTLILLCISNEAKMRLTEAKSRFFELVNDLNANQNSSGSEKKKGNFSVYDSVVQMQCLKKIIFHFEYCPFSPFLVAGMDSPYLLKPDRPPADFRL